jgi:hypothetical protein
VEEKPGQNKQPLKDDAVNAIDAAAAEALKRVEDKQEGPEKAVDESAKEAVTEAESADAKLEAKIDADMAVEQPDDVQPVDTPAPVVAVGLPKSKKKLWLVLALVVVLLLGGAAAWYFLMGPGKSDKKDNAVSTTKTQPAKAKTEPKLDDVLAKMIKPTTGETWLDSPVKVSDLGYVDMHGDDSPVDYYQVGAHGQNTIYMSMVEEMGNPRMLFEKAPDGTVRAVIQPNANGNYTSNDVADAEQSVAKGVITDTTIHYDSLTWPDSFSIGHGETAEPQFTSYFGGAATQASAKSSVTVKTLQTYGASKLVRIERKYADTGLTSISYEIDTPLGTGVPLVYKPIDNDLSTYTWNDGTTVAATTTGQNSVSSKISGIVRGCGSSVTSVSWVYNAKDSDFVAAAKTADGKTVYALADASNPLVQKAYSEYKDFYDGVAGQTVVSLDDFLKQHSLVAYKDPAGEWLVYTRDQYSPSYGCAKPVVYLYPTRAENVTVKLGAAVTKSDPQYDPAKGWTAFAQPNGQLTVAGKAYSSLFWEGQGAGLYPGITSGTVVKRAYALNTIKSQLKQQGLKANEINDFVAYWGGKIPSEPYVRLTWFTTAQMNQLAPISVTPKPDTLIRVFLDMDGYTVPPKLPAQHLSAVPRNGFTVVEWGGLTESSLQ